MFCLLNDKNEIVYMTNSFSESLRLFRIRTDVCERNLYQKKIYPNINKYRKETK